MATNLSEVVNKMCKGAWNMSIIALAKVTQTNWSNSLCKDLCKPQHNTLSVDTTVRGC